jgi:hypothetical protein
MSSAAARHMNSVAEEACVFSGLPNFGEIQTSPERNGRISRKGAKHAKQFLCDPLRLGVFA